MSPRADSTCSRGLDLRSAVGWTCRPAVQAALLLLVLIGLGVRAAQISVAALEGARDVEDLAGVSRTFPHNTAYAALLARADIIGGRLDPATRRLEDALGRNPASAGLWLDLARAAVSAGKMPETAAAAMSARRREPMSAAVCHDAAVLLFQVGSVPEALAALRCAVDLDPQRARDVYDLAWSVVGAGAVVHDAVVPDTAEGWRGYMSYARQRRPEDTAIAWARLTRHGPRTEDRFDYVEFLTQHGRGAEAAGVWAEAYGPRGDNLVFDGSFEAEPVGRGLGWVLGRSDEARTAVVAIPDAPDGRRALQVAFTGSNVDYRHAYQVVPVDEGQRYQVRAVLRAEELYSLSAPRLVVRGYGGCALGEVAGREWKGTMPWAADTLDFAAPPGCSTVIVQVRRRPAGRFGSNISGRLWLDRVEIVRVPDKAV